MSTGTLAETTDLDRTELQKLIQQELVQFKNKHPKSHQLFKQAKSFLHQGVPMNWMVRWAGEFPIFVERASGAHFVDVDGCEYIWRRCFANQQ